MKVSILKRVRIAFVFIIIFSLIIPGCLFNYVNVQASQQINISNPGFEDTASGNSLQLPGRLSAKDWGFFDWAKPSTPIVDAGITETEKAEGQSSAYICSVTSKYAGWTTKSIPVADTAKGYRITYSIKKSQDYVGNVPYVFVTFFNGTQYLGMYEGRNVSCSSTGWSQNTFEILRQNFPANTTNIVLNFTTSRSTLTGANTGTLYYDNVNLDELDANDVMSIQQEIIHNSSFEQTYLDSPKLLPGRLFAKDWGFYDWANPATPVVDAGITNTEKAEGQMSAYICSVSSKYAGWTTKSIPIPDNVQGYKITYSIKESQDYTGNVPYIFINYYNGTQYLGMYAVRNIACTLTGWTQNTFEIYRQNFPAGTTNIMLILTSSRSNLTGATAGALYFDDIKLEALDETQVPFIIDIKGETVGNWWTLGQDVVFKSIKNIPLSVATVKGSVYDSNNSLVADISVSASDFVSQGWKWHPDKPGFYEVEFDAVKYNGESVPLDAKYSYTVSSVTSNEFLIQRRSFVVAAEATKPISERNPMMGFSYQLDGEEPLELADIIGFEYVRIHAIPWGTQFTNTTWALEPSQGNYVWDKFDKVMENINKYGFGKVGNILYTPQWASPHPEETKIQTCLPGYAAYAPKDMTYLSDFIKAFVGRYGNNIKTWEVWNEAHLPGGSCFWNDTPEKYVELLKTSYQTLKSLQPDSDVWIGGMGGRRYLPFYREILKLGASDYFDTLALHGYDQDPEDYYKLDSDYGVLSKPYVNSEGHSLLVASSTTVLPTEKELSLRMLNEYFKQIKQNAQKITHFEMKNLSEREILPWAKSVGYYTHMSGLFRARPYTEPRIAASVLHNFFQTIGSDISYQAEYELAYGQKAVYFKSEGEPIIALWTDGTDKASIDPEISSCFTAATIIKDWEGRSLSLADTFSVQPMTMYFIKNIDENKLGEIPRSDNGVLYSEYEKNTQNYIVPEAEGTKAELFDHTTKELENENIVWNSSDWKWVGTEAKPEGFEASYAVGLDENGLDLVVDVTDNTFSQQETDPATFWRGDSVQFALDPLGLGFAIDRVEFQAGLTQQGLVIYKETAPYIGGDLPKNWTPGKSIVEYGFGDVEKVGQNRLIYKIHIDKTELYPFMQDDTIPVRMSVLVNDNNGNGRLGYLEWSSGIGVSKNPAQYGKVSIMVDDTAPNTTLNIDNGNCIWYSKDVIVVLSAIDNLTGVSSIEYKVGDTGDWKIYNEPFTITQERINTVQYRSTDKAGNVENIKQQTICIDKTLPDFSLLVGSNELSEDGSFEDYLPLQFKAWDNISGLELVKLTIDGENYYIDTGKHYSADIDLTGKAGSHTAAVVVVDYAGNRLEKTYGFTVTTSINSMRQLMDRFIKSGELKGPLIAQLTENLDQVQQQLDNKRPDQAVKHMEDFIKHLSNEALQNNTGDNSKNILITDAETLISIWISLVLE